MKLIDQLIGEADIQYISLDAESLELHNKFHKEFPKLPRRENYFILSKDEIKNLKWDAIVSL